MSDFSTLSPSILVLALTVVLCILQPSPDVVWQIFSSRVLHPYSLFSKPPLSEFLEGHCDRRTPLHQFKRGFDEESERKAMFTCTFTSQLASPAVDPPDLSVPGQGAPLSLIHRATPCPTPAPHLTLSTSCCTSLFSLSRPAP